MILPQKDALVLTLVVDVFDMHRILIDPGSSVDLLQMSAYRQMGYSSYALENLGRIFSEFNEATIISLGDVVFPIQASLTILNVHFFVVEVLLPYNTIMGWAWLHKIKLIPSTYHQMVSYLMEAGQVDLHGS